jgi:short chain dehydrogenase
MAVPYFPEKRDDYPDYSQGQPRGGIMNRWTEDSVPGQEGRTVVITGGNTGLGFEVARMLAKAGAAIVLACRDPARGAAAAARIRATAPQARVDLVCLDLASLASVREAADQLRASYPAIDLLINNAGGVNPGYQRTEDGFERTLATNHLGPFALTRLVLDRLLPVPGSRVVTVSSIGHRRGVINFDDLQADAATAPSRRTSSPSWPTCCSPTSSRPGWPRPGRPPSRWPRIPATPGPSSAGTCPAPSGSR